MAKKPKRIPDFDDIVFEIRNKEYGAYMLRKNYNRNVLISILIGIIVLTTAIITPYLNAKALGSQQRHEERQVEIKLENLDQPTEKVVPPALPPAPPAEEVQQQKYIPPEVVDSVKPEEMAQLMTMDEAEVVVQDEEVVEIVQEIQEEVKEEEPEPEPFIVVEEMPTFPGGVPALLDYIYENTVYPEVAKENNIQGRVIVKFCVTPDGGVDLVSVLMGVDPELDAETIRVVKTLPPFKPGKQGGEPVPVWFTLPINFQLKQN